MHNKFIVLGNDEPIIDDDGNYEAICEAASEWITLPIKAIEFNEFKYDEDVRKGLKNNKPLTLAQKIEARKKYEAVN